MSKSETVQELALIKLRQEFDLHKETRTAGIHFPHQMQKNAYTQWLNKFTDESAKQAKDEVNVIRQGNFTLMPRICTGLDACPYRHICPFRSNLPIDLQCPLEISIVGDRVTGYIEEFGITELRMTSSRTLVERLVELDLLDARTSAMLSAARSQNILINQTMTITPAGDEITQEITSPILDLKERISREKMKLLSTLVGTPEAKYKKAAALKETDSDDYSKRVHGLQQQLNRLEVMVNNA